MSKKPEDVLYFAEGMIEATDKDILRTRADNERLTAEIETLRRDAERYRKQKERSHRLQRLLKECVKVMQANVVFRDTKVHKDLKARIRIELEDKT